MTWYPEGYLVPSGLRTENLFLEMLSPAHTERDYQALMESRERLRRWSSSPWPTDTFTLQENESDLIEHEREFHSREAFAYTVLSLDQSRCEGCVYINPLDHSAWEILSDAGQPGVASLDDAHGAVVAFWVRESALGRDLDRELLHGLIHWLQTDWRFSSISFMAAESLERDRRLFAEAGLRSIGRGRRHRERELWCVPLGKTDN